MSDDLNYRHERMFSFLDLLSSMQDRYAVARCVDPALPEVFEDKHNAAINIVIMKIAKIATENFLDKNYLDAIYYMTIAYDIAKRAEEYVENANTLRGREPECEDLFNWRSPSEDGNATKETVHGTCRGIVGSMPPF